MNSRQSSKGEYIALTQEWHTIGFDAAKQIIETKNDGNCTMNQTG